MPQNGVNTRKQGLSLAFAGVNRITLTDKKNTPGACMPRVYFFYKQKDAGYLPATSNETAS